MDKEEQNNIKCLMLGFDNAGKSTLLYKLHKNEIVNLPSTIGFNLEKVIINDLQFDLFDIGGRKQLRLLWEKFYENSKLLIYMVDSTDLDRMTETKNQFYEILESEELKNATFVILANKQDQANSMSIENISEIFELSKLKKNIQIFGISVITGLGIAEMSTFIYNTLKKQ